MQGHLKVLPSGWCSLVEDAIHRRWTYLYEDALKATAIYAKAIYDLGVIWGFVRLKMQMKNY